MLFNQPSREAATQSRAPRLSPQAGRLLNAIAVFALISAATAVMMLCPCDSVGMHDHYAISLVALAFLLGGTAAYLLYRHLQPDFGITKFLRAFSAIAIVGVAFYLELSAAMEFVSWLARPR